MISSNQASINELTYSKQIHVDRLARHIAQIWISENPSCFTFAPLDFDCPVFEDEVFWEIYFVPKQGHEHVFSSILEFEDIRDWINDNYFGLCMKGNFIGFWKYQNQFCLDISNGIRGLKLAFVFAQQKKRTEIYHPVSWKCIPVPKVISPAPLNNKQNDKEWRVS